MNYLSRIKFLILLVLLLLFGQGCTPVIINQPIGTEPYPVSLDDLNGIWNQANSDKEDLVHVRVINEKNGLVQLSYIDEDKLWEWTCQLMKTGVKEYVLPRKFTYANCYNIDDKQGIFLH